MCIRNLDPWLGGHLLKVRVAELIPPAERFGNDIQHLSGISTEPEL